eukprot:2369036-Pyramimonas_sp.AAC.1
MTSMRDVVYKRNIYTYDCIHIMHTCKPTTSTVIGANGWQVGPNIASQTESAHAQWDDATQEKHAHTQPRVYAHVNT